MFLCEQQEEERWKEADTYTASTDIGCGTLPTKILTLIKMDNAQSKNEFQDMCGSKHTLGGPKNYRTLNSTSKIAEFKHTLMH